MPPSPETRLAGGGMPAPVALELRFGLLLNKAEIEFRRGSRGAGLGLGALSQFL